MTAVSHDRRTARTHAEQAALRHLVDRLVAQFPEMTRDQIEATVHGRYEDFDGSRVRDFVPILVERQARATLAGAPRHRA